MTDVCIWSVADKLTGANLTECHTRTMVRIDIGSYLKDEAGEFRFVRFHFTLFCLYRTRAGSYLYKTVQQLLHTEVVQRRSKEYRCTVSCQIGFRIKFRINTLNQFQIATQFVCQRLTNLLIQFFRMNIDCHFLCYHLFGWLIQVQFLFVDIVYSFETCSLLYRPRQGTNLNHQFFFELIEQIERVFSFTVHFVDEDNYRSLSHTAHLHQFTRLCFHTLRTVYNDDNTVYSCQCAVCIFSKVLVTGSIENVNLIVPIVEFHHGSRYRNTTLFLDFHPVGRSRLFNLITLYSTCYLYLTTEKQ